MTNKKSETKRFIEFMGIIFDTNYKIEIYKSATLRLVGVCEKSLHNKFKRLYLLIINGQEISFESKEERDSAFEKLNSIISKNEK